MPDLELESEDETEPTPESAVEPKSSQAKEQGGGNLTEDSNANSETVQELADLSKLEDIPCPDILPADLLTPLQNLARRLALPVEGYVTALLPAASAQVSAGTRLELDPSTGFSAPPILWIGLVGDTGTKKSPLLRAIVHPLDSLQAKAEVLYQTRLEDYESEKDAWESSPKNDRGGKPKPPIPREFYLSDYTLEALSSVLGTQSNSGLLVYIDELARFFASMDAYRGGKGGDRQHWLSLYDGGALKVNRKGAGRVYASRTSVSLLGGIQPNIIRKIWQDDPTAEDGLWSRFAWVRLPFSIAPGIQEGPTYDLSGRLKELYQTLAEMPATTYRLSTEAIRVWNKWHHEIENLILQEPSPILRATYPKTRERAARIALVTHLIHAAMAGVDLEPIISAETLRSAIQFTRWLQGQTRLLYAELGVADNPETVKILKFVNRFRGCGWVTTRQIRNWSPGNAKFTFEQCRQFARRVVDLGYAIKNDKSGTDYQVKILPKSGHSVTNSPNAPNSSSFGSDHTQVTPRSFRSQTVEDDPESVTTVTTSDLSMVTSKNDSQNSFEPVSDQVTRNIGKERFDWIPQPGELVRYSGSSQLLKCVRGKTLTVKGVAQQNGYISVAVPSGLDQTIPLKDLKPVKQGVQND
ncbi:MAG: DUF3987 domain-containing protein [Aphanocapsa sp. GSE-SYN-MK-11-07L]|nr:DUF3987 domain-containing protein [Aphanocapsa sp. GSE-SYN-MK-11-07L]